MESKDACDHGGEDERMMNSSGESRSTATVDDVFALASSISHDDSVSKKGEGGSGVGFQCHGRHNEGVGLRCLEG
jgi:hypothetical protein